MKRETRKIRRLAGHAGRTGILALLAAGLLDYFNNTWGPGTFLCLTALALSALLLAGEVHTAGRNLAGRRQRPPIYSSLFVVLCSAGLTLSIIELGLQVYLATGPLSAAVLKMPEEWEKRHTQVDGGEKAYYWHGKLHVYDRSGMRRSTPLPAKEEGRCRVLVFGDSLTYGYGVAEEEAYPALLEGALEEKYRIEVFNLGVIGWQSSNILAAMRDLVPRLEPEVVVYGVCLNDFLDPAQVEGDNRGRYARPFPLPEKFKWEMMVRTATGEMLAQAYDRLLLRLGVRLDFFDDILKGFDGYQERFGQDTLQMNDFVRRQGLPPVVAMTLDQYPGVDERGLKISLVAERLMERAGMTVVPREAFYDRYRGRRMSVSLWEGHPNEEAHRLFSAGLLEALDGHPALKRCLISDVGGPSPPSL